MSDDEELAEWSDLPDYIKNDLIIQVFQELALVKDHPRLLILVTHGFVELLVNALVDHHLKNSKKIKSDSRSFPHSTKLLVLNELDLITNSQFQVFNWFRKLRNKAAHNAIFTVTESDFSTLNSEFRDPKNLYSLCVDLIGGFWNQHIPVLGPVFAPGMVGDSPDE